MKNFVQITLCVLILTAGISLGRDEPLANADKDGLYARSIEQVLRLPADQLDIGIAALIISEQWSDMVPGRRYQQRLDDIALEIRSRLKDRNLTADYRAIAVINEYIFDELGFASVENADNPHDLFLHTVLDKKRGYCLSLSILYLAVAERLGLPLYGVVVPGHFFVRYDDGHVRFNIETTGKGRTADDKHYIEKFKVPETADNIYMTNLSKIQTLGCFFNNLGNSYTDVGDTEQALLALERAVEINPSLAESLANLGNVYLEAGRLDDAIYKYQAAMEINPIDAKTHNNLANAYCAKGWFTAAIEEYDRCLNLQPTFIDAYENLAAAYCRRQMFGNAAATLKNALAIQPQNTSCYVQLGNVYIQMDDYKQAQSHFQKALSITPDSAEGYFGMGLCWGKFNAPKQEIAAYKKALALDPQMVGALTNLANAYFNDGDHDAAFELYGKAVTVQPDNACVHYNLAAAYANTDRYELAVAEYKKAVEFDPQMGDAHNGLAFALYKLKQYKLAWQHAEIADKLGAPVTAALSTAIADRLR